MTNSFSSSASSVTCVFDRGFLIGIRATSTFLLRYSNIPPWTVERFCVESEVSILVVKERLMRSRLVLFLLILKMLC